MVSSSGGNAAGTAFASGTAGLALTLVIVALGLMIMFGGYRIRKYSFFVEAG